MPTNPDGSIDWDQLNNAVGDGIAEDRSTANGESVSTNDDGGTSSDSSSSSDDSGSSPYSNPDAYGPTYGGGSSSSSGGGSSSSSGSGGSSKSYGRMTPSERQDIISGGGSSGSEGSSGDSNPYSDPDAYGPTYGGGSSSSSGGGSSKSYDRMTPSERQDVISGGSDGPPEGEQGLEERDDEIGRQARELEGRVTSDNMWLSEEGVTVSREDNRLVARLNERGQYGQRQKAETRARAEVMRETGITDPGEIEVSFGDGSVSARPTSQGRRPDDTGTTSWDGNRPTPGSGGTRSDDSGHFRDRQPHREEFLGEFRESLGIPGEEELGEGIANYLGLPASEAELAQGANRAIERGTGFDLKGTFEEGFRQPARAATLSAASDFVGWATANPTRAGAVGAIALAEPTPFGEMLLLGGGAAAAAGADTARRANEFETPRDGRPGQNEIAAPSDGNPTFGESEFGVPQNGGMSDTERFIGDSPTGGSEVDVPEGGGVVVQEEIGIVDAETAAGDVTHPSVGPDSPTSPETPTGPTLPAPGEQGTGTGDATNPTERIFPTGEGSVVGRGGYSTPEVEPGGETVSRNRSDNGIGTEWNAGTDWGGFGGPTVGTGTMFGPRTRAGDIPDTAPTPDYRAPPSFEAPPWTGPDYASPPDTATPSGFGEPTEFPEPTENAPGFRWPRRSRRRFDLPGLDGFGSSTDGTSSKSDEELFDSGIWDVEDGDFFSL